MKVQFQTVDVFTKIKNQGLVAVWEGIKKQASNLLDTVIEKARDWVVEVLHVVVTYETDLDLLESAVETVSTELMAEHAAAGSVELEADLSAAPLDVEADRRAIKQILLNLLSNAVKFTPQEGQITVALELQNGLVKLRIADSGPGIDEEDLPLIFERFFRGHNGSSEPGKGLGLSLCREIVELHGGAITATSGLAGGAEFVVTLPAVAPSHHAVSRSV